MIIVSHVVCLVLIRSLDDVDMPHLIGFFAALCCAIATQVRTKFSTENLR